MRRNHPAQLRAAWWALRAARQAKALTERGVIDAASLPKVPSLPADCRRAVAGVLRRLHAPCLTESLVLQAWDAAHGERRDLIIGVRGGTTSFGAHAWLEGDPHEASQGFVELTRHPAPANQSSS